MIDTSTAVSDLHIPTSDPAVHRSSFKAYTLSFNMLFLAALLVPALAAAAPVTADVLASTPDPTQVQINSVCVTIRQYAPNTWNIHHSLSYQVSYGGTGCPQGSVASIISDDRQTMTLIFDSYVASIGKGVAVTENRKNCQLNIDLHYPGGFQYSIFSADYRGYAALDKGVTGTQKSTYYFSGQSAQVRQILDTVLGARCISDRFANASAVLYHHQLFRTHVSRLPHP